MEKQNSEISPQLTNNNSRDKLLPFGIIITCYKGDYFLTKGLLASIKYFMPDVPICIIQDGNFTIKSEMESYNITHVIRKSDVKDEFLKKSSFETRCSNMIAFWESPFKHFLYLDSDIVVWGNLLESMEYDKFDLVYNAPHEPYTEYIFLSQYFDYHRLFNHVPEINIHKHHFFNAGAFIAKRGIFDLEQYKVLYSLWRDDPTLFGPEPQGFINYLTFKGVEGGYLNVKEESIQRIVPVTNRFQLEEEFCFNGNTPSVKKEIVIHWAGEKPKIINRNARFNKPMNFFRKQNLMNDKSFWRFCPNVYFFFEEVDASVFRLRKKITLKSLQRKIKKLKSRSYFKHVFRNNTTI